MSDDETPASARNRRTDERHFACFPAHVNRPDGKTRMALIRDLSVSGALLFTRSELAIGAQVELSLYLSDDVSEVRRAPARVVRCEARSKERSDVWHYKVGVRFDEALVDCEAEIKQIADRQRELGLPPE